MERELAEHLKWMRPLEQIQGAAFIVQEINVYVDFHWETVVGHPQITFTNYKSLANHIKSNTRLGRPTVLVLTDLPEAQQGCRTDHATHDIFIVNIGSYKSAGRDVAGGYFAGLKGSRIVNVGDLNEKETAELLNRIATPATICEWISQHPGEIPPSIQEVPDNRLDGVATPKLIEELTSRAASLSPEDMPSLQRLLSSRDFPAVVLQAAEAARRKIVVQEFRRELEADQWKERQWQDFFDRERWIFGHGLLYVFLQMVQREAYVGGKNLENVDGRVTDYAVRTKGVCASFIAFVEIKVPSARLVGDIYRNRTHGLHDDLSGAVSQILGVCDDWNREGSKQSDNMLRSFEEKWETVQPRGILVAGHTRQLDTVPKKRSFELFRRQLHGVEILTFDELLARAEELVALQRDGSTGDEPLTA